jgi:hypothetical protein
MLKELLEIFRISVGNFIRNGCHIGLRGANPTWLKTKLHACLRSRIPIHILLVITEDVLCLLMDGLCKT